MALSLSERTDQNTPITVYSPRSQGLTDNRPITPTTREFIPSTDSDASITAVQTP